MFYLPFHNVAPPPYLLDSLCPFCLYVFILVASSGTVVWYLQTFCLSFATSRKSQCIIFYWADLTLILNFIFCSMQKLKYVFFLSFIYFIFLFNENTIKTFRLRHGQKNWNITKAKTNCRFECPQVLTRNSLKVTAYKHTYALIEWTTMAYIMAYCLFVAKPLSKPTKIYF